MRRSAKSLARLGVPLLVAGAAVLAMVSPAATASPAQSASAAPSAGPSTTPGTLTVTLAGSVVDNSYPNVTANLSIVDAVTGRPETALDAGNVAPLPAAKIASVAASTASLPAAYLVVLDTSGSMADSGPAGQSYMAVARSLAKTFVAGVGPDDLVKLVTFDEHTVEKTGWLHGSDATLGQAIDAVQSEARRTFVSDGLIQASKIANARPSGYDRRAIVVITDASPADKDANLSSASMRQQLGPPTFVVGLLTPAQVGTELTQLLSDVATYTGGSYQSAGSSPDGAALFAPVYANARSAWTITFNTDALPDANSHQQSLTITDAQQRTGTATVTYRSGSLFVVSPLAVNGLKGGDQVTTDRTVTISVGGTRTWKDARIDLFVDCDPQKCSPTTTASNTPLSWRLTVASMTQGDHRAVVRLTTTDDQGIHYASQVEVTFARSGTTWNFAAVVLVVGIALLAIGAFFIASRRRSTQGSLRRRQ
jgi:Mg-chelatase subunit ChlD